MAGLSESDLGITNSDDPLVTRVPLSTWLNYNDAEIARVAGVTRERVRQIRNRLDLPDSSSRDKKNADWHRLLSLVPDSDWRTHPIREVSATLGIPEDYIIGWKRQTNKPGYINISSLHGITDEEWATVPRHVLAEEYEISAKAINNFMLRHNKPRLTKGRGAGGGPARKGASETEV